MLLALSAKALKIYIAGFAVICMKGRHCFIAVFLASSRDHGEPVPPP